MACAPARFLANDRNLIREATLVPSSVEGSEFVREIPVARDGTAQVLLSGTYTGAEEATYDVEIVDTVPTVPRVSAPIATGAGSSRLVDVAAVGLSAQSIVVELVDPGKPATRAAVAFEGVTLQAREIGDGGNAIALEIDQSGLVYTETDFALLVALQPGNGSPSTGLEGAGFDWETAILGADDVIPDDAKRVAFGDDRATIYLQYKRYVDNRWLYHFVPEIKRAIPAGTPVLFVTGGRTVTIADGVAPDEIYTGIETVYDLLAQVRAGSTLVTVEGVVANDRSPDGQASLELLARTDAHVEPSSGSGSIYAKQFESTFANANARTELAIARCYAVTGKDHPLARVGLERWRVRSSIGGDLGEAVTGEAFVEVDSRFGFTIPRVLPDGYGIQKGRFSFVGVQYVPREEDVEPPPVCPVSMALGDAAVDQTITLVWTKRPSGDCDCSTMPAPRIGGPCLGGEFTEGSDGMSYSPEAIDRLKDLYDWGNTASAALARYVSGWQRDGIPETKHDNGGTVGFSFAAGQGEGSGSTSQVFPTEADEGAPSFGYDQEVLETHFPDDVTAQIKEVLDVYERALAAIDLVTDTTLRADGFTQWDSALATLESDTPGSMTRLVGFTIEKYRVLTGQAMAYAGLSPMGKSDANTLESGDGCWRDWGDSHYFSVEGSVGGGYAPLFANKVYYSSRRANEEGQYFSTHEFGLQINVRCVEDLEEGDTITLAIGDAAWPSTYQVGDELVLPIIAAAPLNLAGGRDDASEQTWSVTGSEFGPFPPWVFTPGDSPTAYSEDGLSFDIELRGIPNAKGDAFRFDVEGGHYRWRVNAGAWSSSTDIPVGEVAFDEGLLIEFVAGAAPSFEAGDVHSFRVAQPWAVSHVQEPRPTRWRWAFESGGTTLEVDLGAVHDLDTFAIAMHTIPEGATLTLEGGDAAADEWTEPVTWNAWVAVQTLSAPRTARYLRLTIEADAAGTIGWLWAGEALGSTLSADMAVRPAFNVARANVPGFQGATTLGKARGQSVAWTEGALSEADATALLAMFDYVKSNHDEPIVLLPNVNRPAEAIVGTIVEDALDFPEVHGEQPNDGARRRYSTSFEVRGIWP